MVWHRAGGVLIMKFLIAFVLFSVSLLLNVCPCFASINANRIAIGGITPYSTVDYAKGIYGKPDSTTTSKTAHLFKYGNVGITGVKINSNNIGNYAIVSVYVSKPAPNNISTPDGVAVGMDASILNRIYGREDKIEYPNKYDKKFVRYYYYANQSFSGERNRRYLCFSVDKGIIRSISCGGYNISVQADPRVTLEQLSHNWQNDFVECGASMGVITYLDKTSVSVEYDDTGRCVLNGTTFTVSTNTDSDIERVKSRAHKQRYMYEKGNKKMYVLMQNAGDNLRNRYESEYKRAGKKIDKSIDWSSHWQYIAPDVFYGEGAHFASIGNAIYSAKFEKNYY